MSHKILFLVNGLKPGGLEIYLKRFINFYDKDFISSCIYCKSNNNNENFISSFDGKINIKINRYSYKNPISYYSFYLFLKKNKFDAVCDFSGTFAGPYLLISKILKIKKRIVFFRESRFQFDINFLRSIIIKIYSILLKKSATKFLSNSKDSFKYFLPNYKRHAEKYHVVYNGIPQGAYSNYKIKLLRKKLNISKDDFVVGHIGRFHKSKNHELIIEIARFFTKKKYNKIKFILAGRDVEDNIKNKIEKYNLKNNVIFTGHINDVYDLHQLFDLFLFPSLNEGLPNALIEAIYSKIPILASNIPAHQDLLPKYIHPSLVDLSNKNGYVEIIKKYFNNENLYSTEKLKHWALKTFDPKLRFSEFYNHLI